MSTEAFVRDSPAAMLEHTDHMRPATNPLERHLGVVAR
jgi:hypothetical protein